MISLIKNFIVKLMKSPEEFGRSLGVKIGNGCSIMTYDFGSEPYLIEIGDYVQITKGVKFFTHGGGWVLRRKYPKFDCFGKIKIGSNVYIGNNVLIMPGVVVGNNVVVGAGSIVSKSVPDNSVVAGVPARIISSIADYEDKLLPFNMNIKGLDYDSKKKFLLDADDNLFIVK